MMNTPSQVLVQAKFPSKTVGPSALSVEKNRISCVPVNPQAGGELIQSLHYNVCMYLCMAPEDCDQNL